MADPNAGLTDGPFLTIQKCANVAAAGDTCLIRSGTYRETVTPAASGTAGNRIVYRPYSGENVTIDGADPLSSWVLDSDNIYKTTVSSPTGLFANQIFVDGVMLNEARWPDISTAAGDHYDLDKYETVEEVKFSTNPRRVTVCDTDLNGLPTNYWAGGKINIGAGKAWFFQTGTITASGSGGPGLPCQNGSGYVTFELLEELHDEPYQPIAGNKYFLYGVRSALDSDGEWYYDSGASTLYVKTASGDNPGGHTVTMKQRNYAFDLSGRSYIDVRGFNMNASTILTDASSHHIIIDSIHATYLSHYMVVGDDGLNGFGSHRDDTGIILNGSNNIIRNSTLAYSAGNGVTIRGNDNQVVNNLIHDTNYIGTYNAGIRVNGAPDLDDSGNPGPGILIKGNTIYNTGRDGIIYWFNGSSIVYNHIYNVGYLTHDNGVLYTGGIASSQNVVAYNILHDNHAALLADGLYLDEAASPFLIHHNVVYNIPGAGLRLNGSIPSQSNINNLIYNNTFAGANNTSVANYLANHMNGNQIYNNIFEGTVNIATGASFANNTTNPLFVNAGSADFHLQSNSPGKDHGLVISGITDGFVGDAPDAGAYEYGGTDWTAGYASPNVGSPDAPEISSTGNVTVSSFTVNWNTVSGATGYKIKYGTSRGIYTSTTDVGNVTSANLTGLNIDTKYYYAVTAYNANGESSPSFEQNATTLSKLTGYWAFENDVSDGSGYGNNGTNTDVTFAAGKNSPLGQAASFNGTSSYVSVPHNALLAMGTPSQAFTVSAWIKTSAATTPFLVKGRINTASHIDYNFGLSGGKLQLLRWHQSPDTAESITNTSGPSLNDNAWHHVVFVNESASSHKLYIDGILAETSTAVWTQTDSNTEPLTIGRFQNATYSDTFYNGLLDDVRVYQRALTADQVARLAEPASAGYWRFESNMSDSSGNGNNGTLKNLILPTIPIPYYETGKDTTLGNALHFYFTYDYVSVPHHASISMGSPSRNFTIAAWIKTTESNTSFLSKGRTTPTSHVDYNLGLKEGKLQFSRWHQSEDQLDSVENSSGPALNDNVWHHVAFVNEGASSHKLYVDGSLVESDTKTWKFKDANTEPLTIGMSQNAAFNATLYLGLLDDVRIVRRALNATEIAQLAAM